LQLVRQALPAPQTNGVQATVLGVPQLPLPLQSAAGVNAVPLQSALPHGTVAAAWVQAPAPLHIPVLPQVVVGAQRACGSAVAAPTLVQVPSPFRLQAWQVGQLALPQQTLSTQLPLLHSLPLPQV
jgi:hypothetical protein